MTQSYLGVYYAPWHWRDEDVDYMRRLNPAWVRIHQPSARAIYTVQQAAPNAKIMLRSWDIDDHNGDRKREMYADPKGAARKHLEMWKAKWDELERELKHNGWGYNTDRWYLGLVNEPDPAYVPQVVEYTLEAMHLIEYRDIRLGVVCSSVGTFSKPSENDHGWTLCKPLEQPINDGGHILIVHEYWQPEGPSFGEDAGNLAWRHRHIPLNVPILIGESGANGYIYNRHSDKDDAGWSKFMSPEQYAAQVREYIAGCDTRVQGVCLYMTDYHSAQWKAFDTLPAHETLLAIADTRPQVPSPFATTQQTTHMPNISTGAQPAQPSTVPVLVHPVADPRYRTITQVFGVNGSYYSRFSVDGVSLKGHNGIDYGTPIGTVIAAVDAGKVVEVAYDEFGYGRYVKLVHSWGESLYAHLDEQYVSVGDTVGRGEYIGTSGNTGNSTGPHLHFGLRVSPFNRRDGWGGFVNPEPYLPNAGGGQTQPATDLMALIRAAADEFDLDWRRVAAQVMAESSFNPKAESAAGAKGLMQVMPATWAEFAPQVGAKDPWDARDNLRVGCVYMAWLRRTLSSYGDNSYYMALVAYGWGIGHLLAKKEEPPLAWRFYASNILFGAELLKGMEQIK